MTTIVTGTGNIGTTIWVGGSPDGADMIVVVRMAITQAALLGSLDFTINWTDPITGTRSHSESLLLTALGAYVEYMFPLVNAPYVDITYSVALTGLLGSTEYTIAVGYANVN